MIINKQIEDNKKFITIDFIDVNISYICAILSKLKDKYLFTFNCDKVPYIGIEDKNDEKDSTLYEDIDNIIKNYDENSNYYNELPQYLKIILKIYDEAITDNEIEINTEDIGNMKHLSFTYKEDIEYNYAVCTSFDKYFMTAKNNNFIDQQIFNTYLFKTKNKDELIETLIKYNEDINNYKAKNK